MDESGYDYRTRVFKWWEFSGEAKRLLIMATLPLLDGFFLAYISTDIWRNIANAVSFGLTAFSGAGCFIAAMDLKGGIWRRLFETIKVYALVLAISIAITMFKPVFDSFLPDNLNLFTGLFLIGLGLTTSGIGKLKLVAKWIGFDAAIKIILAASVLNGLFGGVAWKVNLTTDYLPALLTMSLSGFCLTLTGIILGLVVHNNKEVDHKPLNLGAAVSLVSMGVTVLGVHIHPVVVLSPLLIGSTLVILISIQKKYFSKKQQSESAELKNLVDTQLPEKAHVQLDLAVGND